MTNNFDMFTKKGPSNTSENLPYAFSHIATGAPPSVYMSMMTGNTFDQAMQETNNIPMELDEMDMDVDLGLGLDSELEDPDVLEKAIYQLRIAEEKEIEPEEVMETPYGPGLSGEEIDLLLDMYPALDAGVDLDMIDENFDEVDSMLGKSGESIEAAMDAAEQRAEDEGDIGASPAMMKQLGDSLGNSLEAMLNPINRGEELAAESFTHSPFDASESITESAINAAKLLGGWGDISAPIKDWIEDQVGDQALGPYKSLWGQGDISDPIKGLWSQGDISAPIKGKAVGIKDWLKDQARHPVFGGGDDEESQGGKGLSLMETLMEPNKDGTFLSPAEVVEELRLVLSGQQAVDQVNRFLADENLLQEFKGGEISDLRKKLEEFVGQQDIEPAKTQPATTQAATTQAADVERFERKFEETYPEAKDEDGFLATPMPKGLANTNTLLTENLTKAFYTSIYAYPEAGRSDVRARLPYVFNDTRTLFFLEYGPRAVAVGEKLKEIQDEGTPIGKKEEAEQLEKINTELGPMETRYKSFLAEYLADPASKRSGAAFRDRLALISDTLSQAAANPDRTTWTQDFKEDEYWIEGMFGASGGEFADKNRSNLIKMAASQGGRGYYSSLIHNSVDRVMNYYKRIGWTDEKIFAEMAKMTGMPVEGSDAFQPVVQVAKQITEGSPRPGPEFGGEDPAAFTEGEFPEDDRADRILDGEGPTQLLPGTGFDVDPMERGDLPYVDPHAGVTQAGKVADELRKKKDFSGMFPLEGGGRPIYGDYDVDPMERDYGDVYSTFLPDQEKSKSAVADALAAMGLSITGQKLDETVEKDPNAMYMYDPMDPRRNYTFAADPGSDAIEEAIIRRDTERIYGSMPGGELGDMGGEIQETRYPGLTRPYDVGKSPVPFTTPTETKWFQGDTPPFAAYQDYKAAQQEEEQARYDAANTLPTETKWFRGDTGVFPGYAEHVARREEEERALYDAAERNNFARFLENIDNTIDPGLRVSAKPVPYPTGLQNTSRLKGIDEEDYFDVFR